MKIEYRQGDLFQTDIQHIAHGCNARGVMGKGVAKQVRDLYPKAYEEYRTLWLRNTALIVGSVQFVDCESKTIINAITQRDFAKAYNDPGRYVSYDAIAECMAAINKTIPGQQLAMPQIGASLGGGNWEIIERIIECELTQVEPVVYLLK
jgi:O-acetyl-ADP-ribose deacetylase (regulator of RNase III)